MIEKAKTYSTSDVPEKAILVAVATQKQPMYMVEEHLAELAFLATTAGVETIATFTQKLERPDSKTYVGKGKLQEIMACQMATDAELIIFDDDLTPSQVRNLEALLKVKILDRSLLILNIFSQRAQTAQAKTQVELAQYQYMYPRLTRLWTHLTKQKAGVGMRGPGEKELETDKRIVQDRIVLLKNRLKEIDRQSITQRKGRDRMVRVAIVGYTNVGKSTLMNDLAKSDIFAENKLFATVDSTVRKVVLNQIPFLLTDTVGFIRKLPTHLIESFKSTLDEVREADILLHVVDISHPYFEQQIHAVDAILQDIGAVDKPTLLVFNKVDMFKPGTAFDAHANAEALFDNSADSQLKLSQTTLNDDLDKGDVDTDAASFLGLDTENQDTVGDADIDILQPKARYNYGVRHIKENTETSAHNYASLEQLNNSYLSKGDKQVVFISAKNRTNIAQLRQLMFDMVLTKHKLIFPNFLEDATLNGAFRASNDADTTNLEDLSHP